MDVTRINEDYVMKNLYREAKIMHQLHHPCIATLFQTMQHGSVYYLITELIDGGDLCAFIKTQKYGKLSERNTKVYARQLFSAVAYMHKLGIVHRDLKMQNIMVNAIRTQIKIVDFGLSNIYDSNNLLRTHCGSPEFAAPELFISGKLYGPEIDMWSLGVILYGMVVGHLPFIIAREENTTYEERRKSLLSKINRGLSASHRKYLFLNSFEFRSLIAKLLEVEISKRIKIDELLHDPWTTDRATKIIIVDPFEKLDENLQSSITKEVGRILRLDSTTVKYSMVNDPLGDVTGMYNILAYKLRSRRLNCDGVTKPNTVTLHAFGQYKKDTSKPVEKPSLKKINFSQPTTPRTNGSKEILQIIPRPQTSNLNRNYLDGYNDQINLVKRGLNCLNRVKPTPPLPPSYKNKTNISISRSPRRQARSVSRPNTPYDAKARVYRNEAQVFGTKVMAKVLLENAFPSHKGSPTSLSPSTSRSNSSEKIDSKSAPRVNTKRVPTALPKKSGVITVTENSKPPIRGTGNAAYRIPKSRRVALRSPQNDVELSIYALGDVQRKKSNVKIASHQHSSQRSMFADPIARYIAGYIANNVPNSAKSSKRRFGTAKLPLLMEQRKSCVCTRSTK